MARPVSDEQRARFEENLNFLRGIHPALIDRIMSLAGEPEFERSSADTVTLKVNGRYVESPYDAEKSRHDDAGGKVKRGGRPDRPIAFLGSGLGYHINRTYTAGRGGVLIEKDLALFRAALYIIEPEILKELDLLIDAEISSIEQPLSLFAESNPERVEHARSMRLHGAYYRTVKEIFERARKSAIASHITTQATMRLWVSNVFRNLLLPDHAGFVSAPLINAFQGPVILVASGPFLEEASDAMRRLSMSVPLIALLPSVPYLKSCGIMPDFVVSTDGGFWNRYRYVRHCRVPLITTYSAEPTLVRSWEGAVYLFSHALPVEGLFSAIANESLTQPMQGTASLVMLALARRLGFSDFYLAGYDFSFEGLKDHHLGAGFDAILSQSATRTETWETVMLQRQRGENLTATRDSRGGEVLSTHKLLLYRNWFEREVDLTGVKRLNRGAEVRGLEMAHPNHAHAWSRGVRSAFLDAVKRLPARQLRRGKNMDDARVILRHAAEARDGSTMAQLHTRLFGSAMQSVNRDSVKSDLHFVQGQLSMLVEKRT